MNRSPAPEPELPPPAWPWILGAAGLALILLLSTAWRYGYHRDELYFLEASKHLAWGYVDQPPLSMAIIWLTRHVFGQSLFWLRFAPALAAAGIVVLTGLIARELGGGRLAQGLAALGFAVCPLLVAAHLAGPTIYDFLGWAGASILILRILRTGGDRLWLAVGAVAGLSLENKETFLLLVGGLALGLLLQRRFDLLGSPWLWGGAAVAALLWLPNILWEVHHSWPLFEMSRNLHREHSGLGLAVKYPFLELLLPGWYLLPVWVGGLVALLREPRFRPYRAFGTAYLLLFVLIWIVIPDRPYYFSGLLPVLLGAGGIVAAGVVLGTRRFLSERPPRRRVLWRSPRAAVTFVCIAAAIQLPVVLPVLPPNALHTIPIQKLNYNMGEEIGWPALVRRVAAVYRTVPASARRSVVILGSNYGEAGAIDRYGGALGLPGAFSGHNTYWWWGPPAPALGTTISIGYARSFLLRFFSSVRPAVTIHTPGGVDNDENGQVVWICTGQRAPWSAIWPRFRDYG